MSLRVAVVSESFLPSINGVTNSVVRVLETFKQHNFEALVIAPTAPTEKHLGFKLVKSASVPLMQFAVAVPGPFLQAQLEDFAPDLIHVASPFMLGGQAIAAAERMGVPSVAVYQTDISGYMQRYNLRFARPMVDRLIAAIHQPATLNLAPTPETAGYLERLGVRNVHVWGRGVDLDLFHPNRRAEVEAETLRSQIQARAKRKNGTDPVVIGFVGRLAPEKQVQRLAELFGVENTAFLVVGDGPERPRLEAEFTGHPVTFAGRLSGLELARAYAAIDIFVHFGTEETFGQTIQEAQAAGLPVVAPAAGGPKFLIEDGVSGRLAEPFAKHGFTKIVSDLVADADLRAKLGEGARRAVIKKSWQANNAKLLEFYNEAITLNSAKRADASKKALNIELV
jgi:phosphatidylinositol alpha 1,6-mannosyltransferase